MTKAALKLQTERQSAEVITVLAQMTNKTNTKHYRGDKVNSHLLPRSTQMKTHRSPDTPLSADSHWSPNTLELLIKFIQVMAQIKQKPYDLTVLNESVVFSNKSHHIPVSLKTREAIRLSVNVLLSSYHAN